MTREQIEDQIKLKKILIMLTQTLLLKIQKFGDHQLGDTKKYMGMIEQFQNEIEYLQKMLRTA
jgi:hypothetical protein